MRTIARRFRFQIAFTISRYHDFGRAQVTSRDIFAAFYHEFMRDACAMRLASLASRHIWHFLAPCRLDARAHHALRRRTIKHTRSSLASRQSRRHFDIITTARRSEIILNFDAISRVRLIWACRLYTSSSLRFVLFFIRYASI